ncbi:MAG TPA: winged helix-turn-helix domain-containing protein [Vicinamibacterales bacterium]|nr:winged helix-turn-helix domain-containing protein [Vicinamibacterales bacterium]
MREHDVWVFDDFELDLTAWRLTRAGRPVLIEPKALAVLALLVARHGQAVTKTDILDDVWKDTSVTENTMVRVIAQLRAALGDDSKVPKYIETVHTRGYRFIGAVRPRPTAAAPPEMPTAVAPEPPRALLSTPAVRSFLGSPTQRVVAGAIVVGLILAAWLIVRRSSPASTGTTDEELSIAILPLENLGPPDQQYFADGMTDALTTQLAGIGSLKVIAHDAVRQYGTHRPAPSVIARELSVGRVVEGSALMVSGRVRIDVRLVDARTDRMLWGESFEGDLRDVLTLQSRVAREIVAEIRARVTPDEHQRLARTRTVAPEAYQEYLWGLFEMERGFAMDAEMFPHLREAIRRLSGAVAMEPEWAEAHGALGLAHFQLAALSDNQTERLREYQSARESAERAQVLDPTAVSARLVLARVSILLDGDWTAAERQYRELFRLEPNNADYSYGVFLSWTGRFEESLARLRYALERAPTNPYVRYDLGMACVCAGRLEDALVEAKALRERLGDDVNATLIEAMVDLRRQRFDEAYSMLDAKRAALAVNRATTLYDAMAYAAARAGQRERARAAVREVTALGGGPNMSVVFALDGPDAAVRLLRDWVRQNDYSLRSARCWVAYDDLRSIPEVREIFKELGIADAR